MKLEDELGGSLFQRSPAGVIRQFNDQYPGVQTSVTTVSGRRLAKLLTRREVDIAIIFDPDDNHLIDPLITQKLRVRAVVDARHPLASRQSVSLEQCLEFLLILPDHSWPLRDQLDLLLVGVSLQPNVVTSSNSIAFIRRMPASEHCVGFQTIVGIERQVNQGTFVTIPLIAGGDWVTQEYTLCMHKDHKSGQPLKTLVKFLKSRFQEYGSYY